MHATSRRIVFSWSSRQIIARVLQSRLADVEPQDVAPQELFGILASALALVARGITLEGISKMPAEEQQIFLGAPKTLFYSGT